MNLKCVCRAQCGSVTCNRLLFYFVFKDFFMQKKKRRHTVLFQLIGLFLSPSPPPLLETSFNLYSTQVTMCPFTGCTGHCPLSLSLSHANGHFLFYLHPRQKHLNISPLLSRLFLHTNPLIMLSLRGKKARFCSLLCPSHRGASRRQLTPV